MPAENVPGPGQDSDPDVIPRVKFIKRRAE